MFEKCNDEPKYIAPYSTVQPYDVDIQVTDSVDKLNTIQFDGTDAVRFSFPALPISFLLLNLRRKQKSMLFFQFDWERKSIWMA